jgi:6-phosphofructokinase 1
MAKIKRIGVLTSGGDAPGMNAAIRAVTRTAIYHGLEVYGIRGGYHGMITGEIKQLESSHVSNIIQRGGTILKTARSAEFRTPEGRAKAYANLVANNIDALVIIGGDGSLTGALKLSEEHNIPCVGVPGTIDNDLFGTDYTIGYDTAINTVVEAVDKIRDTASAHNRLFFVEVMGRDAGFIALRSGIACGAEAILVPEIATPYEKLKNYLETGFKNKKTSGIVIVAEGDAGGAMEVAGKVKVDFPDIDVKVTVLGHIQRGGSPSAYDRVAASQMGAAAVQALLDDQKSVMIGLINREIVHVPFNKCIKSHKAISGGLLELNDMLSI